MKNNKPLLGAMHIVGKDTKGQRIVLPTIIPKNYLQRDDYGKPMYKLQVYAKRILKDCKNIIKDFKIFVDERVLIAQEIWRTNKREELGLLI